MDEDVVITGFGLKEAVAPLGRPEALKLTATAPIIDNEIGVEANIELVASVPGNTTSDDRFATIENSGVSICLPKTM
jgi:hypothetical protein